MGCRLVSGFCGVFLAQSVHGREVTVRLLRSAGHWSVWCRLVAVLRAYSLLECQQASRNRFLINYPLRRVLVSREMKRASPVAKPDWLAGEEYV